MATPGVHRATDAHGVSGPARRDVHRRATSCTDAAGGDGHLETASGRNGGAQETFGALLDQFSTHCEVRGLSPTTMKEYRRIAATTLSPLRGVRPSKLTARDLDRLYAEMTTKGNGAATIRRTHALARVALHQGRRGAWSS